MSRGRTFDAYRVATLLRDGYEARVVGDKPLLGVSPTVWVDDELVIEARPQRLEAPGIMLEREGERILYATSDIDRATALLSAAQALAS